MDYSDFVDLEGWVALGLQHDYFDEGWEEDDVDEAEDEAADLVQHM
jgi:hypothetical protein